VAVLSAEPRDGRHHWECASGKRARGGVMSGA
jgi:hypothetical protein